MNVTHDGKVFDEYYVVNLKSTTPNIYSFLEITKVENRNERLILYFHFGNQLSLEHVSMLYGSPKMLRDYRNAKEHAYSKRIYNAMPKTDEKVDLNKSS